MRPFSALACACVFAACHRPALPDAPAPPPAAAEWPVFNGDGFEIRMPGTPADSPDQTAALGTGAMTMHAVSFITPAKDAQYGVTTFDFPTVPADIAPLSQLYVLVRDRITAELGGQLLSDVQAPIYSFQGDELELEQPGLDGGPPARISGRYFSTGRRIYFVSLLQRGGAVPEESARRFFESFQLTP